MRRLLFIFVLSLALGALLVQPGNNQGGYVLISLGNHSLETSVWFASLCLLILVAVVWFAVYLIKLTLWGVNAPVKQWHSGSERRLQRQAEMGLVHFLEGNWQAALKQLSRSAPKSTAPLLGYLAAARCAYELGEHDEANGYLARAEQEAGGESLAILLAQARMQMLGKEFEKCLATLQRAKAKSSKHPVVLDMLKQVYMQLHDWEAFARLLPSLEKLKLINEAEAESLYRKVYTNLLQAPSQASSSLEKTKAVWQKIPKHWRTDPDVSACCAAQLEKAGDSDAAELLLRKALQRDWNDRLIVQYASLEATDPGRQMLYAENWLQERPGNSSLLLALGRLSMRNELWGKARDYYEASLKIKECPEAYAEIARLLSHLGQHELSTEYYQKGLLMMASRLPVLPMPHPSVAT